MAKQIREFPIKAVSVMSNMDPDPMTTRYCRLEASSSKYLSASQEKVSICTCQFRCREFECVHDPFRCEQVIILILLTNQVFYPLVRALLMAKVLTIKPQHFGARGSCRYWSKVFRAFDDSYLA